MNDMDHEFWVEEYVLGTLAPENRKSFEKRLQTDINLQQQVNDFQARMLYINDKIAPISPTENLHARIARSVNQYESLKKQASQPKVGSANYWESLIFWRNLAFAGFFATCLLGIQVVNYITAPPPEPTYVAVLVAPQDKSPGWVIQTSQSNQMQLIPLGAVEIPKGKALQFWTKANGWNAPVSLGLVKEGSPIKVDLDQLPPLEQDQLFELTLEDESGSPTGKPTGPIYSIGRGKAI